MPLSVFYCKEPLSMPCEASTLFIIINWAGASGRQEHALASFPPVRIGEEAYLHRTSLSFTMLHACSYEPAIALLLEVIQSSPNLPDPYHTLGLLYEQVCPTTVGHMNVQVTVDVKKLSAFGIHRSLGASLFSVYVTSSSMYWP